MNIYEIFKGQKVRIAPLLTKSDSYAVTLSSGSFSRFKDTCEYYFKAVKMMKGGTYNVTWSCMCYDNLDIDCTDVCVEDVPAMIVYDYIELSEGCDLTGVLIGVFNFDDVYNDCDCYEDGWQLEYFKERLTESVVRTIDADYNQVYTFDIQLDPVRVYNIKDGKMHVEINIREM